VPQPVDTEKLRGRIPDPHQRPFLHGLRHSRRESVAGGLFGSRRQIRSVTLIGTTRTQRNRRNYA